MSSRPPTGEVIGGNGDDAAGQEGEATGKEERSLEAWVGEYKSMILEGWVGDPL